MNITRVMTVNECAKLPPARTHIIPHPNVPPHDFLRTNFTVPRTGVTMWTGTCGRSGAVIVCSVYITPPRVAWLMFRNSKKERENFVNNIRNKNVACVLN